MKKGYLYFLLILILSWFALVFLGLPIMKKPKDFAEIYQKVSGKKLGALGRQCFSR